MKNLKSNLMGSEFVPHVKHMIDLESFCYKKTISMYRSVHRVVQPIPNQISWDLKSEKH